MTALHNRQFAVDETSLRVTVLKESSGRLEPLDSAAVADTINGLSNGNAASLTALHIESDGNLWSLDDLFTVLSALPALQDIHISGTGFDRATLETALQLPNVQRLELANAGVDTTNPGTFVANLLTLLCSRMPSLSHLSLDSVPLRDAPQASQPVTQFFQSLATTCPALQALLITDNSEDTRERAQDLPNEALPDMSALGGLANLEGLILEDHTVTPPSFNSEALMRSLAHCPKLSELTLTVMPAVPAGVVFPSLRRVDVTTSVDLPNPGPQASRDVERLAVRYEALVQASPELSLVQLAGMYSQQELEQPGPQGDVARQTAARLMQTAEVARLLPEYFRDYAGRPAPGGGQPQQPMQMEMEAQNSPHGVKRPHHDGRPEASLPVSGGMPVQAQMPMEGQDDSKWDTQGPGDFAGMAGGDDDDDDDDDEGGPKKKSKGNDGRPTAKRNVEIKFIADRTRRLTTFSKRKEGIIKKAHELSTLAGAEILLLVASETGHLYSFTSPKLRPMVGSQEGLNMIAACLSAPDPPGDQQGGGVAFEREHKDELGTKKRGRGGAPPAHPMQSPPQMQPMGGPGMMGGMAAPPGHQGMARMGQGMVPQPRQMGPPHAGMQMHPGMQAQGYGDVDVNTAATLAGHMGGHMPQHGHLGGHRGTMEGHEQAMYGHPQHHPYAMHPQQGGGDDDGDMPQGQHNQQGWGRAYQHPPVFARQNQGEPQ